MNEQEVLRVEHMNLSFRQYDRRAGCTELPVIRDLNVTVHRGEMVAVVGASGSGKSLLAHGILGILPENGELTGELFFEGEPLTRAKQEQLRGTEILLVPQSVSYLDPLMKVGPQVQGVSEPPVSQERMRKTLSRYGLGPETAESYPFQLSGGMTRRVLIATATVGAPRLVIADEPTPGLHLEAARRVLSHFREFADQGCGVLLITHDLQLAAAAADRVVVFYAGTTVEDAAASDFRREELLRHPYSRALWRAIPENGFQPTAGTQPFVKDLPAGCPFGPRCEYKTKACLEPIPWRPQSGGYVRCVHRLTEASEEVEL